MQENRLGNPNYGGKHKYAPGKIFRERKYLICGNLGSHQSKVMSYLLMSISWESRIKWWEGRRLNFHYFCQSSPLNILCTGEQTWKGREIIFLKHVTNWNWAVPFTVKGSKVDNFSSWYRYFWGNVSSNILFTDFIMITVNMHMHNF